MTYMVDGILVNYKYDWNPRICSIIDGTRRHHVVFNKQDSEREISRIHICARKKF